MSYTKFAALALLVVSLDSSNPSAALASINGVSAEQPNLATAIVTTVAPIFVGPVVTQPLRVAALGTKLNVLAREGAWVQVQFADPQYGPRTGWIQAIHVRVSQPELEPMDLSVNDDAPVASRPRAREVNLSQPAVPVTRPSFARTWLDVNFGSAFSGADDAVYQFRSLIDRASAYGKPSRGAQFDFGGGYMVTPVWGVGVSLSGAAHEDVIGLGAGIGNLALAAGVTPKELRTEAAVNLQAMLVPIDDAKLRIRIFGGPSYYQYKADMVHDFAFLRGNVTTYETAETEGTGWGAHVGTDITYFFTRVVGVAGFGRYSRATASIMEPMSETQQDVKLGGFQTGGGLRFRF